METDSRRFEQHFFHSDNTVTVKKRIRDMVVLARQDVIKEPFNLFARRQTSSRCREILITEDTLMVTTAIRNKDGVDLCPTPF
jgi:chemotaxis methyl-accepting protein methylase